jgi:methionine salvage enolase-phosphatase E1
VPRAFERWKAEEKLIAIYSSGSVLAQQLIFRYSNRGDLTPMIDRYFDTGVGGKASDGKLSQNRSRARHRTIQDRVCF